MHSQTLGAVKPFTEAFKIVGGTTSEELIKRARNHVPAVVWGQVVHGRVVPPLGYKAGTSVMSDPSILGIQA